MISEQNCLTQTSISSLLHYNGFLSHWLKKKDTVNNKNSATILLKKMALLRANQIILQGSQ